MDGYGKVYKSIMREPTLTVEARFIYAYLCSIAGGDGFCFPALDTILHDMNITKQRYYKHLNMLIDAGIIDRVQEKENGRFGRTIYKIMYP